MGHVEDSLITNTSPCLVSQYLPTILTAVINTGGGNLQAVHILTGDKPAAIFPVQPKKLGRNDLFGVDHFRERLGISGVVEIVQGGIKVRLKNIETTAVILIHSRLQNGVGHILGCMLFSGGYVPAVAFVGGVDHKPRCASTVYVTSIKLLIRF